ncbi:MULTISPECIES: hypothetical protein [unclassified Streptosporangium]|nr:MULTISPECIES: hypothetical protein [unclassified Streptosporangium]
MTGPLVEAVEASAYTVPTDGTQAWDSATIGAGRRVPSRDT